MWLRLICYQCNIDYYVYKIFYVSLVANKNIKTYSKFTKDKERESKHTIIQNYQFTILRVVQKSWVILLSRASFKISARGLSFLEVKD